MLTLSQAQTIKVLLVDDHPVVREGLRAVLGSEPGIEMVGEACSGAEALQKVSDLQPEVILMDIQLPETNGLEVMRQIHRTWPDMAVIILTVYDSEIYCIDALRSGAQGYLLKDASCALVAQAIRAARSGGALVEGNLLRRAVQSLAGGARRNKAGAGREEPAPGSIPTDLTPRELDVLRLLAKGYHNKAISDELHLAAVTVKKYVQAVIAKLGTSDRTQAALLGARLGLAD